MSLSCEPWVTLGVIASKGLLQSHCGKPTTHLTLPTHHGRNSFNTKTWLAQSLGVSECERWDQLSPLLQVTGPIPFVVLVYQMLRILVMYPFDRCLYIFTRNSCFYVNDYFKICGWNLNSNITSKNIISEI